MKFLNLRLFFVGLQYGRIFDDVHDIVMMMTILLPGNLDFRKIFVLLVSRRFISRHYWKHLGTSVVYYGDEIGMTGYLEEFDCDETKDPYATRYCTNETDKKSCYNSISRDPMRTPMQVRFIYTLCNSKNMPFIYTFIS